MAFSISEIEWFTTSAPTSSFKHMIHVIDVQFVAMSLRLNEAFQVISSSTHVNADTGRHINIFNSHTNSFNRRISHSGAALLILFLCTSSCIVPMLVINQASHYHFLSFSMLEFTNLLFFVHLCRKMNSEHWKKLLNHALHI